MNGIQRTCADSIERRSKYILFCSFGAGVRDDPEHRDEVEVVDSVVVAALIHIVLREPEC